MSGGFDRRQLRAMCFVASLAAVTRLLPKAPAQAAGNAGWLAPLCALPLLLLFLVFFCSFMKTRREDEGLGELILRRNGRALGSALLLIAAAYLLLSSGFILRTGAHRLNSTIYPAAGPWMFMLTMLALGTAAALGPVKALPRASRVFAPILTAVMLLAVIFALGSVDPKNLFPLYDATVFDIFLGSLSVVEIYGSVIWCAAVLEAHTPLEGGRFSFFARWLVPVCLLLTVFCAVMIGIYGAALTARFSHPFFSMVRDVTLFQSLERLDALVAALWVLSDFVVFSMQLCAAAHLLRLVLGRAPQKADSTMLDMKNGRLVIPLCAALTALAAALLPSDEQSLSTLSQRVFPALSLAVILLILSIGHRGSSP